jgi:hypothetical protein
MFDSINLYSLIPVILCVLVLIGFLVRGILHVYRNTKPANSQGQTAIDGTTDEHPIAFSGEITPSLQEEVRKLYITRDPLYPIIYVIFAVLTLVGAAILSSRGGVDSLLLIVVAIAFFVAAFWLPQIWWRWSWPQYTSQFGPRVSGEVYPEGIRLSPSTPVVNWRSFVAAETSDTLILLYLSKSYAYPIHRSMLKTDLEWDAVISLSKMHIRNFKRRG